MPLDKGLTGLANLGNTCFMNTCMQLLSHTHELDFVLQDKNIKDGTLLHEWKVLRKMMWSENCTVNPKRWLSCVQAVARKNNMLLFTGYSQNDMAEFMLFVISNFHDTLSREVKMTIKGIPTDNTDDMAIQCYTMMKNIYQTDYSDIMKIFFGIHVSQIIDPDTKEVLSNSPEPYFMIELPIPSGKSNLTLYDCFTHYSNPEHLGGENAWYNEKTKKKADVEKQMVFWSFPTVLVIALKRFTNTNRKLTNLIDIPLDNLDLSKYVSGYDKLSYQYELYGVANHTGNAQGGHYFAYIKTKEGNWFEINDTNVRSIRKESIISNRAYVLIYRKKK